MDTQAYYNRTAESPNNTTTHSHQPSTPTNNEKTVINLHGVSRTLLIPLIAREYDNTLHDPILGDPYAKAILDKITFDSESITLTPFQKSGIALRTSQFDRWTQSFLRRNPRSTVLHLACGFDSRMQRMEWGGDTRWVDIDLPGVIQLRMKIQPVSLPGRDYSLIEADVLDPDWMRELGPVSGPVLVIMEGLLAYLSEQDVRGLLRRICETFPEGEMLFEGVSSIALQRLNESSSMNSVAGMGVVFQSSIDDALALEDLHPHLKLVESVPVVQAPGVEKLSTLGRMIMYLSSWFVSGRDAAKLLRFRFGA